MKVAYQICDFEIGSKVKSFAAMSDEFTDNQILFRMSKMAPNFADTMFLCKIFNTWSNCKNFLSPVYTESGLCYTFNSMNLNDILTNEWVSICFCIDIGLIFSTPFLLFRVVDELKNFPTTRNSSKWCPEDGYSDKDDTEIYPYRAFGLGKRESFRVMMKVLNQNMDYLCANAIDGYRVTFHLPNELPPMWKKRHHVGAGQVGIFLVAANLITTSPVLRNYAPVLRQCYFNAERKLRFFRFYTQQNCEAECLANFTHSICDCVHFAMPSKEIPFSHP